MGKFLDGFFIWDHFFSDLDCIFSKKRGLIELKLAQVIFLVKRLIFEYFLLESV